MNAKKGENPWDENVGKKSVIVQDIRLYMIACHTSSRGPELEHGMLSKYLVQYLTMPSAT